MLGIVVAENPALKQMLGYHFKPLGFELVQYRNPVKAMSNLEEIDPDAVFFYASDFPRHWKAMLNYIRSLRDRKKLVFILVTPSSFPIEEAAKAVHLGVNGIVSADLEESIFVRYLEKLLSRYKNLFDTRTNSRLVPVVDFEKIEFVFTHPVNLELVTGRVLDISSTGLSFQPAIPEQLAGIPTASQLDVCTLRAGEDLFLLSCRVVRVNDTLGLEFLDIQGDGRERLRNYLESAGQRRIVS